MKFSIRPLIAKEANLVIDYFSNADDDFLTLMGIDVSKKFTQQQWENFILPELDKPIVERANHYVLWLVDDSPIGHSNCNKITFGQQANMHLHVWNPDQRQKGHGVQLLRLTVAHYFEVFNLQTLICEPNAINPPPNKVLPKVGFKLIDTYETTPGPYNLHQTVNRWELERSDLTG